MSGNSNKPVMALGGGYDNPYGPIIPAPHAASSHTTYQATAPSPYNPTEAPLPYNPALASGVAPPHVTTELPPPYSATPSNKTVPKAEKKCDVCHSMIDISTKQNYRTVACNNCQEVTAIKNPPPGKKYLRCQCNCLMTSNAATSRVLCPRDNCRRITEVSPGPNTASSGSGQFRVVCGHCGRTLVAKSRALIRCSDCQQISSVNDYARMRGFGYLGAAFTFLIIGVVITVVTFEIASEYGGVYVVSVGSFVSAIWFFIRAGYYFTLTTSRPPIAT